MNLIELYKKESTISGVSVFFMAVISGIANAFLLKIINSAVDTAAYDTMNFRYLIMFVITFLIFIIGKKYALEKSTMIAENIIRGIRVRLTDKIRNTTLIHLENIGSSEIYTRLTLDTNVISQSIIIIIDACQCAIMLFFCVMYIAFLSKLAFTITTISIFIGGSFYLYRQKEIEMEVREATLKETKFFGLLEHILNGIKEIKVNRKKNDDLFGFFSKLAKETEELKIRTGLRFVMSLMFSGVAFYILLGAIVFLMPRLGEAYSDLIIRITAAILFIMSPLEMVMSAIPAFMRVNVSAQNLYDLERKLDDSVKSSGSEDIFSMQQIKSFEKIEFSNVVFHYLDSGAKSLFSLGPMNLSIQSGEILFIVGGNGSGKSTFLKLLTGLYYPASGIIKIDKTPVSAGIYPCYRELFSHIFSDFHLFDRLYGLDIIDEERLYALLEEMKLDEKTSVVNGAFTNINLSTGQKKRLAMLVALLEDRDICIFDEWAADQDPAFREYYYNILLKNLKAKGKTIIAVSHDDRYFHIADRVLKMEFGKIVVSGQ